MSSLGIGLIVAGGFLFGIGMGHVVLFGAMLATVGVIMIALGLVAFFWKPGIRGKTQKTSKGRN